LPTPRGPCSTRREARREPRRAARAAPRRRARPGPRRLPPPRTPGPPPRPAGAAGRRSARRPPGPSPTGCAGPRRSTVELVVPPARHQARGSRASAKVARTAEPAAEVVAMATDPAAGFRMAHPLDMLTADEITRAVEVLRATGRVGDEALFAHVVLREPPKDELARWKSGDPIDREVRAQVVPGPGLTLVEAGVSLARGDVREWHAVEGRRP